MSNVVKLPKVVAWHPPIPEHLGPAWQDTAITLSAILCSPGLMLCRDSYLSLLSERIQCLVNACPNPQDITDALVEDLFEAGVYPDLGHVASQDAGAYLVSSNPGIRQRLDSWGVLPTGEAGPTHEMPAAREVLTSERYDIEDHLRSWAAWLGRLP
ncbi:MAG TPA: hypothetical protein VFX20_15535 [Steroidobacteraceae bacterium]|nr:hypothetical protein [Steroidobacteraceae bacterium]